MTHRELQGALPLSVRGGRRPGAGRKPKGDEAGLPHVARPRLSRRHPVHVTLRVRPHVWSLRSQRGMAVVESALRGAAQRPGFRLARFSVQGNHVHLVVEAATAAALASGMKALAIRLARGMNRLMARRGPVLEDRFHAHVLRTPAEVRRALAYVADNFASHARRRGEVVPAGFRDPRASGERPDLVSVPRSWRLRRAMTSAESSDGK